MQAQRGRTLRVAQAHLGEYPRLQHSKTQRTFTKLQKITLHSAKLSLFLMLGIRATLKGYDKPMEHLVKPAYNKLSPDGDCSVSANAIYKSAENYEDINYSPEWNESGAIGGDNQILNI